MIKRILIGLGGTPYTEAAIARAVELAQRHTSSIAAVTVIGPDQPCKLGPVPAGAGAYAKKLCANRQEVTEQQVAASIETIQTRCKELNVPLSIEYETAEAFSLLVQKARTSDLIVFGLRSMFDFHLVDDPLKNLLHLLSKGVRPFLAVSKTFHEIKRIAIAISPSMESANAMKHFIKLGLWPQATVDVVHIANETEKSRRIVDEAAEYCSHFGHDVRTHIVSGSVSDQLLEVAGQNSADLIVMGKSVRNILIQRILGDTTLNTIMKTDLPLFISQ